MFEHKHKNSKNNIIDVFTDSKTQVEYRIQNEKWFLELPYENNITERTFDTRKQAINELIKWQINNPYHQQPVSFASPSYRVSIQAQELQELNSQQKPSFLTSMFISYLLLSGEPLDVVKDVMTNISVSPFAVENSFWSYRNTLGSWSSRLISPILGTSFMSSKLSSKNIISNLDITLFAINIIYNIPTVVAQGSEFEDRLNGLCKDSNDIITYNITLDKENERPSNSIKGLVEPRLRIAKEAYIKFLQGLAIGKKDASGRRAASNLYAHEITDHKGFHILEEQAQANLDILQSMPTKDLVKKFVDGEYFFPRIDVRDNKFINLECSKFIKIHIDDKLLDLEKLEETEILT